MKNEVQRVEGLANDDDFYVAVRDDPWRCTQVSRRYSLLVELHVEEGAVYLLLTGQ